MAELYLRFQPKVASCFRYHLVSSVHAHRADDLAEDLSADVFVRVCEKFGSHRPQDGTPFSAWLYRIAHNHLIDFIRKRGLPGISLAVLVEDGYTEPSDARAERAFDVADQAGELAAAYAQLPDEHRRVLFHHFVCARSLPQTARLTGKSQDSVK